MRNENVNTGNRFGRLVVIKEAERRRKPSGQIIRRFLCQCDCGKQVTVTKYQLSSGKTQSCGCIRTERIVALNKKYDHGEHFKRLYKIWLGMKARCYNKNETAYPDYGGRGITICDEWKNDFASFYCWSLNNNYQSNLTIDRINNNGIYEPNNCRWSTKKEQNRNTRANRIVEHNGILKTVAQLAEESGILDKTLYFRLDQGYQVDELLRDPNDRPKQEILIENKSYTREEIASIAGITLGAVRYRLLNGVTGKDLLKPRGEIDFDKYRKHSA
jgi:hypothetical protein